MGIPSFYRHLCRRFPKIIGTGVGDTPPAWLCMDFNCAMYYVLRRQPAFEPTAAIQWESDFQKDIASYMSEIATLVHPTAGVYISCDGVVCAAKRKQQRLRRFKGPWMNALEEAAVATGATADTDRWDQNALTPGSAFMAGLSRVLNTEATRLSKSLHIPVIVSDTEEPGEGEHKLMTRMREVIPASCAIYGLDADLILLGLLLEADTGSTVSLVREAQEFEGGNSSSSSNSSNSKWRHFSIAELRCALIGKGATPVQIRDFVAAMTLLGNDFLPRSLTRTVRDDGIPSLIASLKRVWATGSSLVRETDHQIQRTALLQILTEWADEEEKDMTAAVRGAIRAARTPPGIGSTPEDTARKVFQSQPARWCSMGRLMRADGKGLRSDWRRIYGVWSQGSDATTYLQGVAWVWDYYSGRAVDRGWSYEGHVPPLWSQMATTLMSLNTDTLIPPPIRWAEPLPSWVHLLSVLPVDSVERLLPPAKGRDIIAANPWWWPSKWSVFDVGRTQLWEVEAVIPVIPEAVLRSWVKK